MRKINPKEYFFTLIELVLSITVFLILIVITLSFFNTADKVWKTSGAKRNAFEDGRMALELISRDLHSIYYTANTAPFWFKPKTSTGEWYDSESLNFISLTDIGDELGSSSELYEVKYFLWYPDGSVSSDSDGWLMRSITGDASPNWNFGLYPLSVSLTGSNNAFTANNDSSEPGHKIIPHVTKLEFRCFNRSGIEIPADVSSTQEIPYSIEARIFVLPKAQWDKWLDIGGNPQAAIDGDEYLSNPQAASFRENHEILFSKTILLSERGQN